MDKERLKEKWLKEERAAQRELKNWGVRFTDGGRKRLITAEEARLLLAQGKRPGQDAVLTPLAKEIMEGKH